MNILKCLGLVISLILMTVDALPTLQAEKPDSIPTSIMTENMTTIVPIDYLPVEIMPTSLLIFRNRECPEKQKEDSAGNCRPVIEELLP